MYASIMILLGQVEDRRAIAGRQDTYMAKVMYSFPAIHKSIMCLLHSLVLVTTLEHCFSTHLMILSLFFFLYRPLQRCT